METFLDDNARKQVAAKPKKLGRMVTLVYFMQPHACASCREQQALVEELAGLSDKVTLEVRELVVDDAEAKRLNIDRVPATAVLGDRDCGIRFYGLTGGYEFASLLESIVMVSTGQAGLAPETESMARAIGVPIHLEVLITLGCPYCPSMVRFAHQLAFANDNIRADMVDAGEFHTLVQRYQVRGVPRMIINGRPALEGAVPPDSAMLEILREGDPQAYERVDAKLREARGERRAAEATPAEEYDVIVMGGGSSRAHFRALRRPNTEPVKELLKLNDAGEIPVERDPSTEVLDFLLPVIPPMSGKTDSCSRGGGCARGARGRTLLGPARKQRRSLTLP